MSLRIKKNIWILILKVIIIVVIVVVGVFGLNVCIWWLWELLFWLLFIVLLFLRGGGWILRFVVGIIFVIGVLWI